MSGYDYSDVLDGDGFEDRQTGGGLRKQLEQVLEQNKKLIERLEKQDRKDSTESLLKEKGLNPEVAGMIPDGQDPAEWLQKYGHLVGGNRLDKDTPADLPETQVAPDPDLVAEQEAQARMQQSGGAGSHVVQDQDPIAKLNSFQTEAELLAFLAGERGEQPSGLF